MGSWEPYSPMKILNTKLGLTALTHRSWLNENPDQEGSNERLEFLGDAVLELIVSEELYRAFPDRDEGFLTALRSNLVNTKSLAALAKELSLGDKIRLSKGEEASGGRTNQSLLADTVEAVIGAIYLEEGLDAARIFIKESLLMDLAKRASQPLKDPKSRLQELVQSKKLRAPFYRTIKEGGPDHAKHFVIEAVVGGKIIGTGEGASKAEAEQNAAKAGLENLSSKD